MNAAFGTAARRWSAGASALRQLTSLSERSRVQLASFFTLGAVALAAMVYVFLVGAGNWTDWPETSDYYHRLGDAFRNGQTHLLLQPDPRLADLPDPYDPTARDDIGYLWDASYYRGRYYLYWGPAPALMLVAAEAIAGQPIGDQTVTFAFVLLSGACLAWILFYLWRRFHPTTSPLLLGLLVLAAVLLAPLPWLLSRPEVYEAAIASGQAFFLLGLALALPTWGEGSWSPARLFFAGLCWALAVGSRATLLPAILALSLWLAALSLRQKPRRWAALLAFLTPLCLGGFALASYNWTRFGSLSETGLTYALTLRNLQADAGRLFSLRYIPSNLFNYGWMPIRGLSVFPYVKPQPGIITLPLLGWRPDGIYGTEVVSGVLRTTPVLWLSLYPVLAALLTALRAPLPRPRSSATLVLFALPAILTLAVASGFFFSSGRYQMDFLPAFFLLAACGTWMAIEDSRRFGRVGSILPFAIGFVLLWGLTRGLLLAVTGPAARLEHLSPTLFEQLTRFLTP